MKLLFTVISATVLATLPALGDPQKPAATQPSTYTRANKAQADVSKSGHDTSNAIIKHIAGKTAPSSNKTHGNLGGGLQKGVTKVDANRAAKEQVRKAQKSLEMYKQAAPEMSKQAAPTPTKPKLKLRVITEHEERQSQATSKYKIHRPSNKTHGVLGDGLLDQGSGFNQSGPTAAGAPMTSGAPTSRGQVIK